MTKEAEAAFHQLAGERQCPWCGIWYRYRHIAQVYCSLDCRIDSQMIKVGRARAVDDDD